MGMSKRDLDTWADALGVNNDDDALGALVSLMAKAEVTGDTALDLANQMVGLTEESHMTSAARCLDEAYVTLQLASRRFDRHERGIR